MLFIIPDSGESEEFGTSHCYQGDGGEINRHQQSVNGEATAYLLPMREDRKTFIEPRVNNNLSISFE